MMRIEKMKKLAHKTTTPGVASLRGSFTWALGLITLMLYHASLSQTAPAQSPTLTQIYDKSETPLLQLGVGDEIKFQVYGQNDMDTVVSIADDGTVRIPLAGAVNIAGQSPTEAAHNLEKALRDGKFLVNPQVTLTVTQTRSQRVSVLGEVRTPGRYTVDSRTTIFDLLAQAGGVSPEGGDVIYLMRADKDGTIARYPINLKGFEDSKFSLPTETMKSGDSIFVPKADQFYISGEVTTPGKYRLETNMPVIEAIARAGGITLRGSSNRIEIKRRLANGKIKTLSANGSDIVEPNDVIRVKESIF